MVSITLSVPEEVKKKMAEFDEVNWSGFIRKCLIEKTKELNWKTEMREKLKKEKEVVEWSVGLNRITKQGRFEALKSKGLI